MATYSSQEIRTLTNQANRTPQFAAPSNSLGGDIVNAIGTGLQFYQQQQAKGELKEASAQMAMQQRQDKLYEEKVSKAALGYSQFLLEAEANGLKPTQLAAKQKDFLKSLGGDSTFRSAVIQQQRTMTGNSAFSTIGDLRTAEDKAAADAMKKQQDLIDLRDEAAKAAATTGRSVSDIKNMSEQELVDLRRKGMVAEAKRLQAANEVADAIQSGRYEKMEKEKKTNLFISNSIPAWGSSFSSNLHTTIDEMGGIRNVPKQDLFEFFDGARAGIEDALREYSSNAAQLGITLTKEQRDEFRSTAENIISLQEERLTSDRGAKAYESARSQKYNEAIDQALVSPVASERRAAKRLYFKQASGEQLDNIDMGTAIKVLSELEDSPLRDYDRSTTKTLGAALRTPDSDNNVFSDEIKQSNADMVENALDGTRKQVNSFAKSSGIQEVVGSIAETKAENIPVESHATISQDIYTQASKRMPAAIAAVVKTAKAKLDTAPSTGVSKREMQISPSGSQANYTLDPNTLEFKPLKSNVFETNAVNQYNTYIRNVIKALEYTGGDVEAFKKEVVESSLISM